MSWARAVREDDANSASLPSFAATATFTDALSLRIVSVSWETGTNVSVSGVSDGTNSWSPLTAKVATDVGFIQAWYRFGGPTGSTTVTATYSANATWNAITLEEFTHDGTGALDNTATNSGSSASASSGSFTIAGSRILVWAAVRTHGSLGSTSWTIDGAAFNHDDNIGGLAGEMYDLTTTTGSVTATMGITSQSWAMVAASFKETDPASGLPFITQLDSRRM